MAFVVTFLFYFYASDKKRANLYLLIVGCEAMLKKLLAISYREPRPSFLDDSLKKASCHCVYGNPSGHMSYTVNSYFFFYYYIIYLGEYKSMYKIIILLSLILFIFLLGISWYYFASHFIN